MITLQDEVEEDKVITIKLWGDKLIPCTIEPEEYIVFKCVLVEVYADKQCV